MKLLLSLLPYVINGYLLISYYLLWIRFVLIYTVSSMIRIYSANSLATITTCSTLNSCFNYKSFIKISKFIALSIIPSILVNCQKGVLSFHSHAPMNNTPQLSK